MLITFFVEKIYQDTKMSTIEESQLW